MASPRYGPAIVIQRPEYLIGDDFTASVFMTMVRHYISEFNITPAEDFALVVFRHAADCERFCRSIKIVSEYEQVRYTPGTTIMAG